MNKATMSFIELSCVIPVERCKESINVGKLVLLDHKTLVVDLNCCFGLSIPRLRRMTAANERRVLNRTLIFSSTKKTPSAWGGGGGGIRGGEKWEGEEREG